MAGKDDVKTASTMNDAEKLVNFNQAKGAAETLSSIGTVFSFQETEGTWFLFDEKDPNSAEVCLRTLTLEEIKEMRRLFVKSKVVYKSGQRYAFEDPDNDGQNEYIWKKTIVDWRKVLDKDRNPVPCTDENKLHYMNKVPAFLRWVSRCMNTLNDVEAEATVIERKNS